MLGHYSDGGYAKFIGVPERNAVHLPAEIPYELGAIMMYSSSTSFHALRKARLKAGETVVVFGIGGLGLSDVATGTVPLDVGIINQVLDDLEEYGSGLRTVIVP